MRVAMPVTLRPATATDLPCVVACVEAAFEKYAFEDRQAAGTHAGRP
jgi:hypothetical protein